MGKKSPSDGKIRESIVNGIFYPKEEKELTDLIKNFMNKTKTVPGDAFAIISPHAGYSYAGKFIAQAFKTAMRRQIKNIVIVAPIHSRPEPGIYLPESKFFLTPIGSIPVNQELVEDLLACSTGILNQDIPHLEEHCIELQLPFVRYLFPHASIVPILLGNSSEKNIKLLSNALQLTFSSSYTHTLFIVTSNMSAFIEKEDADRETDILLHLILKHDWKGIIDSKEKGEISACGTGCISALLSFSNISYDVKVIDRGSSGDIDTNKKKVVTYASIALYMKNQERKER
ncbi:MAG: AmmeMemoRadiSam system protein B [Spirochaetales bacterium]|nr:AmmeMemoRadiSam system protein B [Spirochaetales bacterium]